MLVRFIVINDPTIDQSVSEISTQTIHQPLAQAQFSLQFFKFYQKIPGSPAVIRLG